MISKLISLILMYYEELKKYFVSYLVGIIKKETNKITVVVFNSIYFKITIKLLQRALCNANCL